MLTYSFICRSCGASFEARLSMAAYSAGEGRVCAHCGSTDVDRSFTTVNVIAGGASRSTGAWSSGGCGTSGFT